MPAGVNYSSSPAEVLCKKVFLKTSQNSHSQENIFARISFWIKLQALGSSFIKKETQTQMFSCEFCESLQLY